MLHTAETPADVTPPDTAAESVARFISTRTDPGSYHSVADSDSIVRVGEYGWEMFGEGTGGNRWALHLAAACRTTDWGTAGDEWVNAIIENMAREAANMLRWLEAQGVAVSTEFITAVAYRARRPGFVTHAQLDPGRRSDPGIYFPRTMFRNRVNAYLAQDIPLPPTTGGNTMATPDPQVEAWQRALIPNGANLGTTGPNKDGVDGVFGATTLAESIRILDGRNEDIRQLNKQLADKVAVDVGQLQQIQAHIRVALELLNQLLEQP